MRVLWARLGRLGEAGGVRPLAPVSTWVCSKVPAGFPSILDHWSETPRSSRISLRSSRILLYTVE